MKSLPSGELAPVEVEILDSSLSSQTDELDVVSDKNKPPPQRKKPSLKSLLRRQPQKSSSSKHVSFAQSSSNDAIPSTSQLGRQPTPPSPIYSSHLVHPPYVPITTPYALDDSQRILVLRANLRHVCASMGITDSSPLSAMVVEQLSQQSGSEVHPDDTEVLDLQLQYPEPEPTPVPISPAPAPLQLSSAPSTTLLATPRDVSAGRNSPGPSNSPSQELCQPLTTPEAAAPQSGEDDHMNVDDPEENAHFVYNDVVMGEPEPEEEREMPTAGDVAPEAMREVVHEAEETPPLQPSVAPSSSSGAPRKPRKLKSSSIFMPKKPRPLLSPSTSTAPQSSTQLHRPEPTRNWTTTHRKDMSRSVTPTPHPQLNASRRGRRRTLNLENYVIQRDRMAKHPEPPAQQTGIADKCADEFIRALATLLSALDKWKGEGSESEWRSALAQARSPFDDFEGGKNFLALDFLKNKPELLRVVQDLAQYGENEGKPLPQELKEFIARARGLLAVWRDRFTKAGSSNH